MKDDLELKDLGQYYGTQKYTQIPLFGSKLTDGVVYVMENGYSWFITDVLAIAELKLKDHEFLSIKLKLDGNKGEMEVTDGNGKALYKQKYEYTDAKRELSLYHTDNVLMLAREY